MLPRLIERSPVTTASPASELERLRADVALASAAVGFATTSRRRSAGAFGLDARLRAADLRAMERAASR